jgi:hypothetical protein
LCIGWIRYGTHPVISNTFLLTISRHPRLAVWKIGTLLRESPRALTSYVAHQSAKTGRVGDMKLAKILACSWTLALLAWATDADSINVSTPGTLNVPRLEQKLTFDHVKEMALPPELSGKLLKIDSFLQRTPTDGSPVSEKTEAYMGYTNEALYVLFFAYDSDPEHIRARLVRRELIDDDDQVGIMLDTFMDRRRAFFFYTNPIGVQQDGILADGQDLDYSWDGIWKVQARVTPQGYVALMEIPFKTLRFGPDDIQKWGFLMERDIRRRSEFAFFPHISIKNQGFIRQGGSIAGMAEINRSRNLQLIPYVSSRSFRFVQDPTATGKAIESNRAEINVGLDTKYVIANRFTIDATANPDFAQVESDDPQVTANQRFEVFFKEKRPFFLENADYFQTPINLVFTRRIIDPNYGVRLTGKAAGWSLGGFVADDRSPGLRVGTTDPLHDKSSRYAIARVYRDLWNGSNVGLLYTQRSLSSSGLSTCDFTDCMVKDNKVIAGDFNLNISQAWNFAGQFAHSRTDSSDLGGYTGSSFQLDAFRSGRNLNLSASITDTSPEFLTTTGFFRRPDIREFHFSGNYMFRREFGALLSQGPTLDAFEFTKHNGDQAEYFYQFGYNANFKGQSSLRVYHFYGKETLYPSDFDTITGHTVIPYWRTGINATLAYFKPVILKLHVGTGPTQNYFPATGQPVQVRRDLAEAGFTLKSIPGLTIENTYLLQRMRDRHVDAGVFTNHIIRSKWNYQFSREFSLRVTGQYEGLLSNPALSSLEKSKRLTGDVLFTYLLHPGTAVYAGYSSGLVDPDPTVNPALAPRRFINDSRTLFFKVSYLFGF